MAVKYRYLGWGTTNEHGVAKLDHNANNEEITHSYTGVGAGKVDIIASINSSISSSSFDSEIYELLDAYFIDDGISATQDHYYNTNAEYLEVSYDSTGKKLENKHDSANQRLYAIPIGTTASSSNVTKWDCDFAVEIDLVSFVDGSSALQVGQGNDTVSRTWSYLNCTGGEHIKIEARANNQTIYVNDVEKSTFHLDFSKRQIYVRFSLPIGASVIFKNLKIYPI